MISALYPERIEERIIVNDKLSFQYKMYDGLKGDRFVNRAYSVSVNSF